MGRWRRFTPRKNVLEIKHYEKNVRELWIRSQNGDYRCEFRLQNCPSYRGTSTVLTWIAIQGWFKVKWKRGYISRETNRVIQYYQLS